MDKGSPVPSEPSAPIQQITVNPATQMRRLFHRANRLQTVAQKIIRCRKKHATRYFIRSCCTGVGYSGVLSMVCYPMGSVLVIGTCQRNKVCRSTTCHMVAKRDQLEQNDKDKEHSQTA